jgi:pseudouridine-5'-phosphate glycosidase
MTSSVNPLISLNEEIADTLSAGGAVVALESTIIAHGLPYPDNLELVAQLEEDIRSNGAVPALILLADGKIIAGPGEEQLERLAKGGSSVSKVSPRDFGPVLRKSGLEGLGATTVAGTVRAAAMAGLNIFATGAIGGVHRGAEESFDISADLKALSENPVAVVSAGAKSILDLPKTLEVLESEGVPVWGYGTDSFPAFYTPDSGLPLEHRFDDAETIAEALSFHWQCNDKCGALIANPITAEDALAADEEKQLIDEALSAAVREGISGKQSTPFVLGRLHERSGGRTVAANVSLVRANARLAARIAVAGSKTP